MPKFNSLTHIRVVWGMKVKLKMDQRRYLWWYFPSKSSYRMEIQHAFTILYVTFGVILYRNVYHIFNCPDFVDLNFKETCIINTVLQIFLETTPSTWPVYRLADSEKRREDVLGRRPSWGDWRCEGASQAGGKVTRGCRPSFKRGLSC